MPTPDEVPEGGPALSNRSDRVASRVLRGVGANVVAQVIGTVSRVLAVPLFLSAWGADVYGEWLLLSSFAAYLTLTDLGGQLYIVNRLTQAYAHRDLRTLRMVLHTGLALFAALAVLAFVLFMAGVALVPPESFLQITRTEHRTVLLVLGVLAFQICLSLPYGLILGVYRAVGMLPRSVMLSNVSLALQFVLTVAALWAGAGMVTVAVLQVVPLIVVLLYPLRDLSRRFPEIGLLSFTDVDLGTGKTFLRPSSQFFLIQGARAVSLHGTVLIVGSLLGQSAVVLFTSFRTMGNVMQGVLGLLVNASWPEITRLDSIRDTRRLRDLFLIISRSTMLVAVAVSAALHLWGEQLFSLWLGDHVEYSQALMDLMLVYLVQTSFWTVASYLLMATNAHRGLSRVLSASAPLSIGLAYVGGEHFGLPGVLMGMTAAELLLPFWIVPLLVARTQPSIPFSFFIREALPIAAGFAAILLLPGWTAPLVLVPLLFWWLSGIPAAGRRSLPSRLRRWIPPFQSEPAGL